MIAYIDMFNDRFGVEPICSVLGTTVRGFMTSRGYRAAKARRVSARALRDATLFPARTDLHQANYGVYGVRKMWHAMGLAGWEVGRDQVARLMRKTGVIRGRKPRTTVPATMTDDRPDLVNRNFHVSAPNQLMGRRHYVCENHQRVCYTAFITDAFCHKIVCWATRIEAPNQHSLHRPLGKCWTGRFSGQCR